MKSQGQATRPGGRVRRMAAGAAVLAAAATAVLAAGGAAAAAFNLQTLIDGNSAVTIGDKRFSGFTCVITTNSGVSGPNACNQISVVSIDSAPLGLTFQSSFVAFGAAFKDVLLGYTVEALDPQSLIRTVGLTFNGDIFGQAIAQVTETVLAPGNTVVGQASVVNFEGAKILQDTITLDGAYASLAVRKDVLLGSAVDSYATISFIDQRFGTPVDAVPEPAALAVVGTGLLGFGLLRRRRGDPPARR